MVKINFFPFTADINALFDSEKYKDEKILLNDFVDLLPKKYIDYSKPNQAENTYLFRTTFLSEDHYLNGKKKGVNNYSTRPFLMVNHISITIINSSFNQYLVILSLNYFWSIISFVGGAIFAFFMIGQVSGISILIIGILIYIYSHYFFRRLLAKNLSLLK